MDGNKIEIRKAKYSDIKEIANIKVAGWQNAYRGIVSDEYLNNMLYSEQIEKYSITYSLDTIFIAEKDNEILGFCRFYNYDTPIYDDLEVDCEIREIYVRPDIKRMGIGSKLFNYTLDYLKK
jgi:ribosomal protein S18 acetylase RimI-like enzyme